ncbi:MAG: phosphotransferase family protein, partial [Steroidobacteraceae bacterium]
MPEDRVSYSIARYLAEIGKTLASLDLAAATTNSMARQLLLTMARMSVQLAVDREYGQAIRDELVARYVARAVDMLPELERLKHTPELILTIRSWQTNIETRHAVPAIAELEAIVGRAIVLLCVNGSVRGAEIANDLVDYELKGLRAVADNCRDMLARGAATRDSNTQQRFTQQQLQAFAAFLKESCGSSGSAEVVEVVQLPGGFSKQTYRVRLSPGSEWPEEVVVRYDPADSVFGVTVDKEFGIIRILHDRGVRVPRPYALEISSTVLGAPFMVTARAPGHSIGDSYQVEGGTVAFGRSLARELAQMHSIPADVFGTALYGADVDAVARLRGEIAKFYESWQQTGCTSIAMECAFHWLRQNLHLAEGRRALIHRDVGCHNLIVADDEVSALVDWEAAAIGNPAQDLGYCLKTVVQFMPWEDFLAAYAAAGGVIPTTEEI